MIIELGVGILAVGALGYATYWQRKRMKLARIREDAGYTPIFYDIHGV